MQDTRNTASALTSVEGADSLGRSDAVSGLDQLLFVDWIVLPDGDESDLLLSQMSGPGEAAAIDWLTNKETRPFDADTYVIELYGDGIAIVDGADALFDAASDANGNSDNYTLAATIVALVLFLSGVSLVLKGKVTRTVLVSGSAVILAGVLVFLIGLPLAGGAEAVDEIQIGAEQKSKATLPAKLFNPFSVDTTVFAVYLDFIERSAASDNLSDDFADVIETYDSEGYTVFTGELACDIGAAEALALGDSDPLAANIYVPTQEYANAFAEEYDVPAENIVEVELSESC
ncbi:MAG: hypothetical protein OEU32_18020 [Acidimicrobiia bacterium]|nr:hypothetical protein [Acidimicrobiia bacterium]